RAQEVVVGHQEILRTVVAVGETRLKAEVFEVHRDAAQVWGASAMVRRDQRDRVENAAMQLVAQVSVVLASDQYPRLVRRGDLPRAYEVLRIVVDLDPNPKVCSKAGGNECIELVDTPGGAEIDGMRSEEHK